MTTNTSWQLSWNATNYDAKGMAESIPDAQDYGGSRDTELDDSELISPDTYYLPDAGGASNSMYKHAGNNMYNHAGKEVTITFTGIVLEYGQMWNGYYDVCETNGLARIDRALEFKGALDIIDDELWHNRRIFIGLDQWDNMPEDDKKTLLRLRNITVILFDYMTIESGR